MSTQQAAIFHLSFPVRSLQASVEFYRQLLGASVGRSTTEWTDVILFGHQLTLHDQPDQVHSREERGVRHFGAILSWNDWEAARARLLTLQPSLQTDIRHRLAGEPGEHVKLLLEDPDGNLIEIKAYKSIETVAPQLAGDTG